MVFICWLCGERCLLCIVCCALRVDCSLLVAHGCVYCVCLLVVVCHIRCVIACLACVMCWWRDECCMVCVVSCIVCCLLVG